MTHDIHTDVKQDEAIVAMHADAERFDPRTEEVFKILQVSLGLQATAQSVADHDLVVQRNRQLHQSIFLALICVHSV
jgi:hypothetical protein